MANLIFKKGTYADFKAKVTTAQEGAFYLTEDEGGLYVGLADGSTKRIQGSVLIYEDIDAIVEAAGLPPYDPNVIYFSAKNNALFRYDATQEKWVQLNQVAEDTANALEALQTSINNVSKSLADYKSSNNAAVALKADKTALDNEISRAKGAEEANAAAAAAAQEAAEAAQTTASTAAANAQANATSINGLTSDLAKVKTTAESKTTMEEVEAKGYATVAQVNSAKSEVIGASGDGATKNTIYGAKAAADAAQKAADGAQSTANEAKSAASTNATAISDEVARAKAAESALDVKVGAKVEQSAYDTKVASLESGINDNKSNIEATNTIAKAAMPKAGGTFTGDVTVQTGATLTLVDGPAEATDAANKAYVDSKVKEANNVSSGLDARLVQAEKDIKANATAAAAAQSDAEAAQSTANTAVSNAAAAQKAADNAAAAAKSANDNANTRVLQDDYDADKAALDASIEKNATSISAVQTALQAYQSKNDAAVAEKLDITTAKNTYATKAELSAAESSLLGSSTDTSAKNTIYGAKAAAAAAQKTADGAQSAADGAQTTANEAKSTAAANATAISNEAARAKAAEEALTTAVDKKVDQAAYDKKMTSLDDSISDHASKISAVTNTANAAMPKAGGTFTGNVSMGGKKLSGLAAITSSSADTDAATVGYVKEQMAAADAMVFKGVLGVDVTALPTTGVQCGWTYKVGVKGTYGTIDAKVGDLIVNSAADNATPNWVHVTSGYEDDYLQKLGLASNGGVEIRLDNGVGTVDSKIVLKNGNGIEWTVNGTEATPSIVWGTF